MAAFLSLIEQNSILIEKRPEPFSGNINIVDPNHFRLKMKRLFYALPLIFICFAFIDTPSSSPWNEEKTDSLASSVITANSTGKVHSSIHYDLTIVLAEKMGFSKDTAIYLARFCALVDQINPKPDYPYPIALNSISIPDTFSSWSESLAGTERGGLYTNAQNEINAQYWHFPFRNPTDTLTGQLVWGDHYPATGNFSYYTGPPYFWRVPITYNLDNIKNWALYNGGNPGLPDLLTPVEVLYSDSLSNGYQLVMPNSLQAFAIFLHSLGDSYSHEECMVHDTLRSHPSDDPYCGLTYHSEHEFAYDVSMRAKQHADSMFHALWRVLREYKRVHGIATPALWTIDNNGFQDGDGIPDQLEDDGDGNDQESFLEKWKNPASSDLNGDGIINHSDHTSWRIQLSNSEMNLLQKPDSINGPELVCEGATVIYSVAPVSGATGYSWTLPSGWSGQSSTNSIIAIVGNSSGNISVCATGPNGNSLPRQLLVNVTAVPLQLSLSNINVLFNQAVCNNAQQIIEVAGNNTTYIVRNGGSSTMIAGERVSFYPGAKVISGGYLHAVINANDCCLPLSMPEKTEQMAGAQHPESAVQNGEIAVKVFPNPTSGTFLVVLNPLEAGTFLTCEIITFQGVLVKTVSGKWGQFPEISLTDEKEGLYFVRIRFGSEIRTVKIVFIR